MGGPNNNRTRAAKAPSPKWPPPVIWCFRWHRGFPTRSNSSCWELPNVICNPRHIPVPSLSVKSTLQTRLEIGNVAVAETKRKWKSKMPKIWESSGVGAYFLQCTKKVSDKTIGFLERFQVWRCNSKLELRVARNDGTCLKRNNC